MGCGAVCGNNSSIYLPNQYSQKILLQLLPQLNHAKYYLSLRQYKSFLKQIKQNPLKYRLKLPKKLIPKQQTQPAILTKWKVILYCFDSSNSHFNNCLGYKFKKIKPLTQPKHQNQLQQVYPQDESDFVFEHDSLIYQHTQFTQIEKDIDRTCELPENKKKTFQRILKRITNYFPQMGYTQGINFIIGYLLVIGFSQFDAFWIFVHIAIHRRYLQLGLLEDKFPLSQVYNRIFRNVLKRINFPLYKHLYQELQMDESMWVFKWFITYFIYSFPFQMIKYVFDIVIEIGGIGLIKFAIAITQELSEILIQEHDVCEISLFFQSLRNIETFNEYLSINKIIQRAYTLEIKKEDFAGIEEYQGNFYSDYILANLEMQENSISEPSLRRIQGSSPKSKMKMKVPFTQNFNQNPAIDRLLKDWYQKLVDERQKFIKKNQNINQSLDIKKITQKISIQNQLHLLMSEEEENSIKSPQKQNSNSEHKNSVKDSVQIKKESVPSTGYSFNKKGSEIHNRGNVSQIDELWEEQDRNSNISREKSGKISQQSRTQNGFHLKVRKTSFVDELDKFASTHSNPLGKSKPHLYQNKISSIFTEEKYNSIKPKINNFQISLDRPRLQSKGSNLARVGQNILTNLSINQNSQYQSTNSDYSKLSQKQKKTKQNEIYGKNHQKNKSKKQIFFHEKQTDSKMEQSDRKSQEQQDRNSSSRDSYMDPQNSFYASNQFIQEDLKNSQIQAGSVKAFESHRQRMNTHQDILTTSLHTLHLKQGTSQQVAESNVSEIEIFQAPQVFKKKNRVSSRINGAQNEIVLASIQIPKLSHTISQADIKQKIEKSKKTIKMGIQESSINYEESYESIFVPSEGKNSNTLSFHQQVQKCEVESVK